MSLNKRSYRNVIACIIIFVFCCQICQAVSTEWDGYTETTVYETDVINFDDYSALVNNVKGGVAVLQNTHDHMYSLYWTHTTSTSVQISNVPRDWSDFSVLEIWYYAENAQDTNFYIEVSCDQEQTSGSSYLGYNVSVQDGWNCLTADLGKFTVTRDADLKKVNKLNFWAEGWNITANPDGNYWFASIKLKKPDETKGSLETIYSEPDRNIAYEAMTNAVSVYAGSDNAVVGSEVKALVSADLTAVNYNSQVYVPKEFFSEHFGATVSDTEIKLGENSVALTDLTTYTQNDWVYVPAVSTANRLGKYTVQNGELVIIGNDDAISLFADNGTVNVYSEIIAYLTAYEYVDPLTFTEADFKAVKDKWREELIGTENNDTSNTYVAQKISSIEYAGQSAWDRLNKGDDILSPFFGTAPSATSQMTDEYEYLCDMAVAWGTSGCSLYHNKDLLSDIIDTLDFLRDNRFGPAEVEGTGWKLAGSNNWWDWKIGAPRELMNILMILEEELEKDAISSYLYCFDTISKSPSDHGFGSNQYNIAKIMFGSAVLQQDGAKAIKMRNAVDDLYLYSDNGRADGAGFYTDGTYIVHGRHVMNGLYGIEQLELGVSFASILADTKFEFSNPHVKNTIKWIENGYIPLAYNGSLMNFVSGRYPSRATASELMRSLLKACEIATDEERKWLEECIKYQLRNDPSTSYYSEISLRDVSKLSTIENDENIRGDIKYIGGYVYSSGDKVVHHQKNFSAGVSMSSERIYNYEGMSGSNLNGWYQGDGMTLIYNENEPKPYDNAYWQNVDPYKLPGTTVDTQERQAISIRTTCEYLSNQDFVGGVTNGDYSVAAMALESYHADTPIGTTNEYGNANPVHDCSLTAQKAWFMFDDEIVALGSNITADDGFPVHTTVENRKSTNVISVIDEDDVTVPYKIVGVTASQVPEEENVPENTLDGSFYTKWAAEGEATIIWELEKVETMGFVGLSFMNGTIRQQIFDLYVSEDGETWTQVFSGKSSGTQETAEIFDLKNTKGKYLRMDSHGSTAGKWLSLTTVAIYPPNADGSTTIVQPVYKGAELLSVDSGNTITENETDISGAKWVHLENTGGYYFPAGGQIMARRTSDLTSFFELWLEHGVSPQAQTYEYVLLPGKTAEETEKYASDSDIEVLSNTEAIQAVREKTSKTVGIVFWQAGSFNGITVDKPMIVMMKETKNGLEISASDPTHKLTEATISINKAYSEGLCDKRVTVERMDNSTTLKIDFTDSLGKSVVSDLGNGNTFLDCSADYDRMDDYVFSDSSASVDNDVKYKNSLCSLKFDLTKASNNQWIDKATLEAHGKQTTLDGYDVINIRMKANDKALEGGTNAVTMVINQKLDNGEWTDYKPVINLDWDESETQDGWYTESIRLDSMKQKNEGASLDKEINSMWFNVGGYGQKVAAEDSAIYIDKVWLE